MLPGFLFLPPPVVAFGWENKQTSSWGAASHPAEVADERVAQDAPARCPCRASASLSQLLLFPLPGERGRRGAILGAEECRSSASIKAACLDFVGGRAKWCCGWALVAQIPGQLLKGFLRDHPKNKPGPSRVCSAHAWTRKLASILLFFPLNWPRCLLMLQLCVVMGTHWPFGEGTVPRAMRGKVRRAPA